MSCNNNTSSIQTIELTDENQQMHLHILVICMAIFAVRIGQDFVVALTKFFFLSVLFYLV